VQHRSHDRRTAEAPTSAHGKRIFWAFARILDKAEIDARLKRNHFEKDILEDSARPDWPSAPLFWMAAAGSSIPPRGTRDQEDDARMVVADDIFDAEKSRGQFAPGPRRDARAIAARKNHPIPFVEALRITNPNPPDLGLLVKSMPLTDLLPYPTLAPADHLCPAIPAQRNWAQNALHRVSCSSYADRTFYVSLQPYWPLGLRLAESAAKLNVTETGRG